MASDPAAVLIVEDSLSLGSIYRGYLRDETYLVTHVPDGASAMARIEHHPPVVLLLDLQLPDMDGMDILRHVHERRMPIAVVVITGHGSVDKAVDAMRYGAFDFVEKPVSQKRLIVTVRNAAEKVRMRSFVDRLTDDFRREGYHGFLGSSLPMQAVYRIIDSAAPSRATVFITGESGSGKEVCAEAIHRASDRRDKPFVAINCAAIPRDLMESEIFGHVKGAFTGAVRDRVGAAKQAGGGTLFLDEIAEMDLDLQTKLLRFVQTGTFQPVGASGIESVDVRFVCATNRDPLAEVAAGRFREDLFYRLHVIPIQLPPLRDREGDILELANSFLARHAQEEGKRFTGFDADVEAVFLAYAWPGNVRQLQNVIQNVVVLYDGERVTRHMLPPPLDSIDPSAPVGSAPPRPAAALRRPPANGSPIRPLKDIEREAIEQAIAYYNDNIPQAAAALGVSPSTIYRKKQTWDDRR
ncbi:MAG: sigma-54 dependent transcriptional regulator [Thiohalocapsa sp.]|uniref:sigma-54-dependent transcriptional regulator n=1 Tax=Thiohalocapsa sp. TaxID=2497641 RepID=UPI0025D0EC76|nr:sigma-54 dependent transcriptional regulator [Thiohalocapsa sp.]MCG6943625.1 sigma-54 dependent transcriptional regulator [Thiohalocapsa sp.]